ncbi:MAG TPA: GAF domain-containing protein [Terriglobales bacterium]|jgi:hypothetical protein|nr:GAF domain-containing protein [Terriglobales bacterium]
MSDRPELEQLERVVSQILERHVALMKDELVRSVQLPGDASIAVGAGSGETTSGQLLKAISAIQAGSTQREILRALLDNMVRYSGRAALFVVKGNSGTGWQGRGFANNDDIRDFALDVNSGLPSRSLQGRMVFSGTVSDMDAKFISRFGTPTSDRILVLPLLLKDKVAALVYADTGTEAGGRIEEEAVELLVLSTSAWLEVAALRKQAQKEGTAAPVEKAEAAAAAAPASNDPFAGHAPKHTGADPFAPQAVAAEPATDVVSSAPEPSPEPAPQAKSAEPSPEDAEVHQKAQRFARLLVDEIKLYNQAKVTEGRGSKNLYDRLREDIDKSKATYEKRYGSTAAASGNYFDRELVRSLAEDDVSVMGSNFRSLEPSGSATS